MAEQWFQSNLTAFSVNYNFAFQKKSSKHCVSPDQLGKLSETLKAYTFPYLQSPIRHESLTSVLVKTLLFSTFFSFISLVEIPSLSVIDFLFHPNLVVIFSKVLFSFLPLLPSIYPDFSLCLWNILGFFIFMLVNLLTMCFLSETYYFGAVLFYVIHVVGVCMCVCVCFLFLFGTYWPSSVFYVIYLPGSVLYFKIWNY